MAHTFPTDICSLLASAVTTHSDTPNECGVLDTDWAYVSCVLSTSRNEITVKLRAAGVGASQMSLSESILEGVDIVIDADDLDVLNGRALDLTVIDLVIEELEVFSRQNSPREVAGMIRLPGWSPAIV
jgi:hypothetical protein